MEDWKSGFSLLLCIITINLNNWVIYLKKLKRNNYDCKNILFKKKFENNSSDVAGIPLPLIGMVAYGAAAFLALKLATKDLPFGIDESIGGLILLGTTTSMATASAYFLYILGTQFPGASCSYCLVSVLLSFSLFFTTAKVHFHL